MTTTAFAANGAAPPAPGILCWSFVIVCAAILTSQTIPAALRILEALKGRITPPNSPDHR
jgi:hypothetical protein